MNGEAQARLIWDEAISTLENYPEISPRDLGFLRDVRPSAIAGTMLIVTVSRKATRDIIQNKLFLPISRALHEVSGQSITCLVNLDESLQDEPAAAPAQVPESREAAPAQAAHDDAGDFEDEDDEDDVPRFEQSASIPAHPRFTSQAGGMEPGTLFSSEAMPERSEADAEPEPSRPARPSRPAFMPTPAIMVTQPRSHDDKVTLPPPRVPATMMPTPADVSAKGGKPGASPRVSVTRDEITHLNAKATFDTFVPGESNRFARAAAIAVSESPGTTYNPLFIYGRSGLGKTHLLNAIGNATLSMYPKYKVRYVTSEEFTNEFIDAVQKSRHTKNDGQIPSFNKRYREVDLLLIDDIQFLKGKEQTLEQFFHTFNTLYNNNKQIVVASDVAPKFLEGFEPRLISRFEMGLPVDVQPPSEETRIAILRMKAQIINLDVPAEVLELIASQVKDNIRELEGALTRVAAVASLNAQPITRTLAEQALQDFFIQDVEVTPTEIISKTASYFGLTFDDIVSSDRSKDKVKARQIAMYITHEMTSLPVKSIGESFGGKDHSTVLHACKKVSALMAEKPDVYNSVIELTKQLKQHM